MSVIDDYLAAIKEPQKSELKRVRALIAIITPDAVETISYGMPAFTYKGKYLVAFAAFKDHYSVFPGANAIEQNLALLSGHKISKGTVQYTADNMLADATLAKLITTRIADITHG